MEISLLISAVLALLDYAEPRIREAVSDGDVTPEDQQKLKDRIDSLRAGGGFDSPEWNKSTDKA